jgi:hypothetical protein
MLEVRIDSLAKRLPVPDKKQILEQYRSVPDEFKPFLMEILAWFQKLIREIEEARRLENPGG